MEVPRVLTITEKPLARNGGTEGAYREIWFTFNDIQSWAQSSFEVGSRISKNRTTQKDEVLAPLEEILKSLASETIEKIFEKLNINIE